MSKKLSPHVYVVVNNRLHSAEIVKETEKLIVIDYSRKDDRAAFNDRSRLNKQGDTIHFSAENAWSAYLSVKRAAVDELQKSFAEAKADLTAAEEAFKAWKAAEEAKKS